MRKRSFVLLMTTGALALVAVASASPSLAASTQSTGETRYLVLMFVYASVALVFSFLCSVAEAVLLSVSPSFIAHLRQQGRPLADRLQRIKTDIDRSLAAILTLNTIAHTVGAGGAGAEAAVYFGERWVGVAMAVLTLLILFLSEIVPKTLGAVYWRQLARPTTAFVRILVIALHPFLVVSEYLTRMITRGKSVHAFSREEFAALAEVGVERGHIAAEESTIVKNILSFRDLRVEDVMTPRTVVFALQRDLSIDVALEQHPEPPFSRILLYKERLDDVGAFVLAVDMLRQKLAGNGSRSLQEIGREVDAIGEKTSLGVAFQRLIATQMHLLLVIDEFGGLAGVITLEDILETLIGSEIVDETDEVDDLRRLARSRWKERQSRGTDGT